MIRCATTRAVFAWTLALLCGAGSASASVVTSMDTEALVRASKVIIRGQVESVVSSPAGSGWSQTHVTVRVQERLKGARGIERVTLTLLGGTLGEGQSLVFGMPGFRRGERVLVFAQPTKHGSLTVTGLFQGKYRIEGAPGAETAVREGAEGALVLGRRSRAEPSRRALGELLGEVRELVKIYPGEDSPAPPEPLALPEAQEAQAAPAFTLHPIIPLRWSEPDSGLPVNVLFNVTGAPAVLEGARGAFLTGLDTWTNVTGSTIVLRDGGDTAAACYRSDGANVVSHDDPCGQLPAFDAVNCSGVLAITGIAGLSLESKVVNGVTFLRLTETDIVVNADAGCFWSGEGNYAEVVAHELGHVVGLGHSCGDPFSPDCSADPKADDALMRAVAHGDGRGAQVRKGDIDGARFIYPPAGFVDVLLNQSAFAAGETMDLRLDLNGTAAADLYLVVVFPDGAFFSLGATVPNTLVPVVPSLSLGFFPDVPILAYTFTGAEPAGGYFWVALLVRPGANPAVSTNWIAADGAAFTFNP